MKIARVQLMVAGLVLAMGCTEANQHALKDKGGGGNQDGSTAGVDNGLPVDGAPPVGDVGASTGGKIQIYVKGDQTSPNLKDGLSGQTPSDYEIALSAYHVLQSANDPAPTLCFDHGSKPVVTNMKGDTLVGSCDTSKFKTGAYTHGRTRVDWARYTVDGVYHGMGQHVAGSFTFFRAYSDTTYKGKSYKAGKGFISFSALPSVLIPMDYGPMPPMPGVTFSTKGGKFEMTFQYPKPLPIVKENKDTHWARFHWKVGDAFRWKDRKMSGYKDGKWDVNLNPSSSEQVLWHGVLGYNVTTSVDK